MRVGIVINQFPSPEHPYIFEWVKELLAQDIDLYIIAEKLSIMPQDDFWDAGDGMRERLLRINVIDQPDFGLFIRSLAGILMRSARLVRLLKLLNRTESGSFLTILRKVFEYLPLLTRDFDIIHFNAPQLAIRRFELNEFFEAVSLVSFRGQDFTFHPQRYDFLLKESDHLHFISRFLLQQACERGYDGNRHSLILPMVDTDFYQPASRLADGIDPVRHTWLLFSAARLEWVKGWEFALQSVALLIERGWDIEYYIAGDGELRDLVLYTIDQLGIADHVHLLGWQSPEQVRDWMQKSDVYVLASVEEAFNNSVLQAQACGLPVVCSDAGGLPENIEDGVTGLLFRRRDAWDMAEKIETLLATPGSLSEMGAAGVMRATTHFSIKDGVSQFLDAYQSLQCGRVS